MSQNIGTKKTFSSLNKTKMTSDIMLAICQLRSHIMKLKVR